MALRKLLAINKGWGIKDEKQKGICSFRNKKGILVLKCNE